MNNFYLFSSTIGFCTSLVNAYPVYIKNDPDESGYAQLNTVYSITLLLIVLSLTFAIGCLCCKRKKGFRNFSSRTSGDAARNIEFANPLSTCSTQAEITLFPPTGPPGSVPITFDPLPPLTPKHQQQIPASNPRPAAFTDALTKGISVDSWFQEPQDNFPRQQLHYLRECGRGWFGRVVEGEARGILPNGRTSRVIVRILREGATESEQKFFLHEAKPYMELSHPNLLRLLGRCLENDPFLLLFEACNGGDLKSWLTQNVASRETLTQQGITLRMAADIAAGLAHMNHHGFVHTDLAARNTLVTSDLRVKVGDYGTSIEMFKDDYYCTGEVALPIRWCAPESLQCTDTIIETKEVTAPANVWSYGVVLWEICEFGKLPYIDLSDDQVIVQVLGSEAVRLAEPSFPSPFKGHLYYLMQLCWRNHRERPSISHILSMLNHLITSKIKTQNDMDDFERRWENMKPNTIAKTDNHTPVLSEEKVKSDSDSGVVLDNKHSSFAGSEMDLSCKKSSVDIRSSSSMTISPQLSVTSSSGGEFFSQTSTPMKLKSPSLQNLQGSLEDINEASNRLSILEGTEASGLDLWLQNVEIKNEKDAKLVSGVYKAISDLDNALSLEKTSSSNESSCYDSPSSSRKETTSNQNPVIDFKLGPFVNNNFHLDKRLKFQPESFQDDSLILRKTGDSSGTDTEDEIWRKRIEKGEFSEKVKEKSKSIADLMVLTHIENSDGSESDSLPSFSFNKIVKQNTRNNSLMNSIGFGSDICIYSSLTAEQSDNDLKKFQNALKNKDMNDPSLNFLRRDSLSYFINNSNFKSSESDSNSSSNYQQSDHFLEISASDIRKEEIQTSVVKTHVPEIIVSDIATENENLHEEPNIHLDIKPKNFKFVYKEKFTDSNSVSNADEVSRYDEQMVDSGSKSTPTEKLFNQWKEPSITSETELKSVINDASFFELSSNSIDQQKPLISNFELGDSGIIMDEPADNSHFILPLKTEPNPENLSVILGSCEDFTLDYYKGLKTCSGNDLTPSFDKDLPSRNKSVSQGWESFPKNQQNGQSTQENYCNNLMNLKNVESKGNCDKISESNECCDKFSFVPDINNSIYNHNRYCEEHFDDLYIDSGKSSDVLDDDNFDLKSYPTFDNINDYGFLASKISDTKLEDCCNELKQGFACETQLGENLNHSSCASSEDFDGVKLSTPDDEKSSDTGFKDRSSLSESYDDVYPDKYNLEDIENELDDINPPSCIQCPFMYKNESQSQGNSLDSLPNSFKKDESNAKPACSLHSEENNLEHDFKDVKEIQSGMCSNQEDLSSFTGRDRLCNISKKSDECEKYQEKIIHRTSPLLNSPESENLNLSEDLPPSYEEYLRLSCKMEKNSEFENFAVGGVEDESGSPHSFYKKESSSTVKNPLAEYLLSRGMREDFKSESENSEFSKIAKTHDICDNGSTGWFLHAKSDENASSDYQNAQNDWLPETILNEDETVKNDSVNEEFLMAIRNELNEKLTKFQTKDSNEITEDLLDDDNSFDDDDDDDEDDEDDDILSKTQDNIFIQYNNFPKSLSPILEEKESDCSSASSIVLYSEYSNSTRTLSPADFDNEVIDTVFDFNNINPDSQEFEDDTNQENDDIIVIDTETNEIRIIESPKLKSEPFTTSGHEDATSINHLENTDYSSDYSLDSISPITGSPSATNPNALSFSSTNENLSEILLAQSSLKSDLTFAEDKTICSEPADDYGTDVEELEKDLSSPQKTLHNVQDKLSETFIIDGVDSHSEAIKSMNDLVFNPSSPNKDVKLLETPVENYQPDSWLKSVLLSPNKNSEEITPSDVNETIVNSFTSSNWPQTEHLTPVLDEDGPSSKREISGSTSKQIALGSNFRSNDTDFSNSASLETNVVNTSYVPSVKNKIEEGFDFKNSGIIIHDESNPNSVNCALNNTAESSELFSNSCFSSKQVELNSTLAFEAPKSDNPKIPQGIDFNVCNDFSLGPSNINNSMNNNKESCDSLEKYKNYCRKKFKITKVDEDIKPILFDDVKNSKSSDSQKDPVKTILTEDELNNRLNKINKEAQERLEISSQASENNLSAFSAANKENCSTSPLWPISSQLLDSENLKKFGLTEIDINDDQMMTTSFIDSNSAENSETDESPEANFHWDEKDSSFDKNQIYENSTDFKASFKNSVDKNEDDDDDLDEEDDEDITDFVPSSWNSSATPNKSALKSPEQKSESKKNVSFKRQRYHCVYEYPREEQSDSEEEVHRGTSWYDLSTPISFDFSAYTDWEMGDGEESSSYEINPDSEEKVLKSDDKHDVYSLTPVDQDFLFSSMLEDGEFFISSSTRPFKTDQSSLNSQFFPGKTFLEEDFKPSAADISDDNNSKES